MNGFFSKHGLQWRSRRAAGFSLIEIAIVLVILAILAVTLGSTTTGMVEARRRDETNQNMQKVETALVSFVSTTRRLPCPADGSLTNVDVNWGLERRSASGACDTMATGVVPWRSVGLTNAEVMDGWNSLFTYRVPLHLTIDNGMTMSDCDPAGTNSTVNPMSPFHLCSAACVGATLSTCTMPSVFLTNKGFVIQNVAGTIMANPAATPPTGAAFVLISAGPTLGPAYNASGQLVASTEVLGTQEGVNQNNQGIQAYYVDGDFDARSTTAHFDDIVRRPSVATIIGKASLGPRAH